jgi:hypothetical protein
MTVRYEDGVEAELNMDIQGRIWENIRAEQEAKAASRSLRAARRSAQNTQHYVKAISIPSEGEMVFPGWQERVVLAQEPHHIAQLKLGDRLIFYALETQTFFAVATITGPAFEADPKDYFYNLDSPSAYFLPIDVDAVSVSLEKGLAVDSVELESHPNFKKLRIEPETFLPLSEDDFELLAELLTEVSEDETEDIDEEEEYEEEDEE